MDAEEFAKKALLAFVAIGTVSLVFLGSSPRIARASDEDGRETSSSSGDELQIVLEVPLLSPFFSDTPVAIVNEEPITVSDLTRQIASTHARRTEGATLARKDYARLLERLVTAKLIVEEARNIGFDELPALRSQVETFSRDLLVQSVVGPELESVEADPEEVLDLYKELSREFLIATLNFEAEEDALDFEREYETRGDFAELSARYVAEKKAKGEIDGAQYMKLKDLLPNIAEKAYGMKPGELSGIFRAADGFLIFYIEDVRFYEDEGVREEARQKVVERDRKKRGQAYVDLLIEKHATLDERLLESLDFEREEKGLLWNRRSEPVDFKKFLDDTRVLATVHDFEPPEITVADLARNLEERQFHGIENAVEKRTLNKKKWPILREMLFLKAAVVEARERGKDADPDYLRAVQDYEEALLFEAFMAKVIAPDVVISEAELRAYYEEHVAEFSSPRMFRMKNLRFYALDDAKSAANQLRKRADFAWVSANSGGQVDREEKRSLNFDAGLLSATALPEALREMTEGAREGDVVLYSPPDDFHYVIRIEKVFPAAPEAYEGTRETIARKLFDAKAKDLVAEWSRKLAEAYETRVFVRGLGEL